MKFLLSLGLLLVSVICSAAIFMQSNTNGEVTYSDTPTQDSKVVNVQEPTTTQFTPPAATAGSAGNGKPSATASKEEAHVPYSVFAIASPTDQQTFQNQRDITVSLNITPKLQKGDKVALFVDGVPAGPPVAAPQFEVHQLNRGTHQITAQLLDKSNLILRQAGPVTVFIHYAAVGPNGGGSGA